MTNNDRAIKAATAIKDLLDSFVDESASNNPFANVGPSDEFLNTHLPESVASKEDVLAMRDAIDEAIANGNVQTINKVLGVVQGLVGGLKTFGILPG